MRDGLRQRAPAIPVPDEKEEVQPRRNGPAPGDLIETYSSRIPLQHRFVGNSPAKIDGFEFETIRHANPADFREDIFVKNAAFCLEICERRGDEQPDRPVCHRLSVSSAAPSGWQEK